MSEEKSQSEDIQQEETVEPLEVKIVKEKDKVVNEDLDYEEFEFDGKDVEEDGS